MKRFALRLTFSFAWFALRVSVRTYVARQPARLAPWHWQWDLFWERLSEMRQRVWIKLWLLVAFAWLLSIAFAYQNVSRLTAALMVVFGVSFVLAIILMLRAPQTAKEV